MFHLLGLVHLVAYFCLCASQDVPFEAASAGRAVTEVDLEDLIRDNLEPDLSPWQPAYRGRALTALDFLDLVHQIDTQWPEYRRNFIAIVAIQSGRMRWWSYPEARSWCTNRVQYIQEELAKHNDSYAVPDTMFVMNAYDKPLCIAGSCPAPLFSFNKPWQVPPRGIAVPEDASQEAKLARKLLLADVPLWRDSKGSEAAVGGGAIRTGRRGLESISRPYTASGNTDAEDDTTHQAAGMVSAKGIDQNRQLATTAAAAMAMTAAMSSAAMETPAATAAATLAVATAVTSGAWRWADKRPNDGASSARLVSSSASGLKKYFSDATAVSAAAAAAAAAVTASGSSALKKYLRMAAPAPPSSQLEDEQAQLVYDDVLFPVLNHPFEQLVYFPWEQKIHQAMMRAGLYPAMSPKCSRVRLYKIAQRRAAKGKLDVGIYKNTHWSVRVPLVPAIPMEDHARWRYLISADGQGASWRLAKLLALNSVVLKARSDSIEYYYRSLAEGKHYVSMDETDLVSVFDRLEKTEQSQLQAITDSAQAFAHRYLSQVSRCAYAAVALRRYTLLYSDMPRLLEELAGRTSSVEVLMEIRSRWRAEAGLQYTVPADTASAAERPGGERQLLTEGGHRPIVTHQPLGSQH